MTFSATQQKQQQQSFRSACDRCRTKKLGCTISAVETSRTGFPQCVRCVRAKLDCVYSRRAQTRRRTGDEGGVTGGDKHCWEQPDVAAHPQPPPLDISLDSSEQLAGFHMDFSMLSSGAHDGSGFKLLNTMDTSDHAACTGVNSLLDEDIFARSLSSQDFLMDMSSSFPMAENACEPTPSLPLFSGPYSAAGSTSSTAEKRDYPSFLFAQLSRLVADIHETTFMLDGVVDEDLDTNAVGSILKLTRRFTAVLHDSGWASKSSTDPPRHQRFPSTSSSSPPTLLPGTPVHAGFRNNRTAGPSPISLDQKKSISFDIPDVSTDLQMLTCYASLTKLYMTVLDQIHNRLDPMPESTAFDHHRAGPPGEPFPLTNETYSKLYGVVQILLDEFQVVEDLLGSSDPAEGENHTKQGNEGPPPVGFSLEAGGPQTPPPTNLYPGASSWLLHQVRLVRAALNQDASRNFALHPGQDSDGSPNGVLQQGHDLKAFLRRRMEL
ncbi:Zn(II)2Cys6 transcription factor domain-containing protein [Aspergillus homomorphus CBS 101889]|uniref:Zn(2)-C6 fungal-type domain-containing protein n=1 Tax=Aspergillus homomorphus (strain CBS 101889) TaxID=1450537 RepID=A0A395HUL2_ASPHC|nr:hypothetical protein BO97DRAFT_96692 [Aspergillus homomorphus CBS 101889]RAL11490.1 hypothetical protein BO97DRAFT_96692 [Aspergillus homomorphus CBS 101889]